MDWISQLMTGILAILAAIAGAITMGAKWWFTRRERMVNAQQEHEQAIVNQMDSMSERHEAAVKECRTETREVINKLLEIHRETIVAVHNNSQVVRENTDATRELKRNLEKDP